MKMHITSHSMNDVGTPNENIQKSLLINSFPPPISAFCEVSINIEAFVQSSTCPGLRRTVIMATKLTLNGGIALVTGVIQPFISFSS